MSDAKILFLDLARMRRNGVLDLKDRHVILTAEACTVIAALEDAALDGHLDLMTACDSRIRAIYAEMDRVRAALKNAPSCPHSTA